MEGVRNILPSLIQALNASSKEEALLHVLKAIELLLKWLTKHEIDEKGNAVNALANLIAADLLDVREVVQQTFKIVTSVRNTLEKLKQKLIEATTSTSSKPTKEELIEEAKTSTAKPTKEAKKKFPTWAKGELV